MDVKLEGRNVDLGAELREKVQKRFDSLDSKFGPLTYARLTVEKHAHKNEQRAEATVVVNMSGTSLTATKDSATVVGAVNDAMDTLTEVIKAHGDRQKEAHRR
ncbi:MAG: hypothetical protein G8345_22070 [Magnetococcales bacterium]|nr:HPF/RaiA family ribosome-associated protein [Magnetococcales bacterium]NGZ29563.1 hypothetical protein [Magnetococcales bacterium]